MNRKFRSVLWITLAWTLISMLQLLYELAVLKEYGFEYRWSASGNFMAYFLINTLASYVIDYQVDFQTIKITGRCFAPFCYVFENTVRINTKVMTDCQFS